MVEVQIDVKCFVLICIFPNLTQKNAFLSMRNWGTRRRPVIAFADTKPVEIFNRKLLQLSKSLLDLGIKYIDETDSAHVSRFMPIKTIEISTVGHVRTFIEFGA
jgi:hypothetical protein